jgi:hypothetical protein
MSYLQFPSETYLKVIAATGETLGSFTVTDNTDLLYVVVNMYIKGTIVGGERMRLNLYASEAMNDPVATSDWLYWSDITDIGTGNYLGWLRFDFSGYPVSNAYPYYVKIETTNYTRNADTYYLAAVCEYAVRLSTIAKRPGVHLAIVGKR